MPTAAQGRARGGSGLGWRYVGGEHATATPQGRAVYVAHAHAQAARWEAEARAAEAARAVNARENSEWKALRAARRRRAARAAEAAATDEEVLQGHVRDERNVRFETRDGYLRSWTGTQCVPITHARFSSSAIGHVEARLSEALEEAKDAARRRWVEANNPPGGDGVMTADELTAVLKEKESVIFGEDRRCRALEAELGSLEVYPLTGAAAQAAAARRAR